MTGSLASSRKRPVRVLLAPALIATALVGAAACGDDGSGPSGGPDASLPDAGGCDPAASLPLQWRPIDTVSSGAITAESAQGVTSALIDATAGGLQGAADNPYIYLDLGAGTRVDITDVDARGSTAWHLGLKRASILVNGGDSGPGTVSAVAVDAASLDEVTAAPASGFATDDWADADCNFRGLPSGEPASAMGDWFDYDDQTHIVTPKAQVWVVRVADGTDYKLRIETYYGDDANPMRGALYRVAWAPL